MKQQFPSAITESVKGSTSPETASALLTKALQACGSNERWAAEHSALLDWACAIQRTAAVLNSAPVMHDTVCSIAKLFVQLAASAPGDLTATVVDTLKRPYDTDGSTGATALLPLDAVLVLLALLHSLLGPDAATCLDRAQLEAFLLQHTISAPLGIGDVSDARALVEPALAVLDKLAQARCSCGSLHAPLVSPITRDYAGVADVLLRAILEPGAPQPEALCRCSESGAQSGAARGVGRLVRKGFTLAFGLGGGGSGSSRSSTDGTAGARSVRDHLVATGSGALAGRVMLVFAGGLSLSELALVRERCAKHRGLRVLLVTTALLTRTDTAKLLFPAVVDLCRTAQARQQQ